MKLFTSPRVYYLPTIQTSKGSSLFHFFLKVELTRMVCVHLSASLSISYCQHLQAEELRKAILVALDEKLRGRRGRRREDELRAAAEAIQYEDWAIDYSLVSCLSLTLYIIQFVIQWSMEVWT